MLGSHSTRQPWTPGLPPPPPEGAAVLLLVLCFYFLCQHRLPSLIPAQPEAAPACHRLALPPGLAPALSLRPRAPGSPSCGRSRLLLTALSAGGSVSPAHKHRLRLCIHFPRLRTLQSRHTVPKASCLPPWKHGSWQNPAPWGSPLFPSHPEIKTYNHILTVHVTPQPAPSQASPC